MRVNNKSIAIFFGLIALSSCSSLKKVNNADKANKLEVKYFKPEYDINEGVNEIVSEIKKQPVDRLKNITAKNFEIKNLDKMYDKEVIYLNNDSLDKNISIVKIYNKKPSLVYKKGSKGYETLVGVEKTGGELFPDKPELKNEKYKVVTDKDRNNVYVQVRDNITGKTKDIRLDNKVLIEERPSEISDNIRYEDLKKLNKDKRVKYKINTLDNPFEDVADAEKQIVNGYEFYDYKNYFKPDKYYDEDDLAGVKRVDLIDHIDGLKDKEYKRNIDFGIKLGDFKDDYSKLLADLSKRSLKLTEDGKVIGGFDEYLSQKIEKYSEAEPQTGKVSFVTEILDKDKNVGLHNVVRKILQDGKVVFQKKEKAFVSFDGVNVAVADGTFFDLSPEVEKRVYRGTVKADDKVKDFVKEAADEKERKKALQHLLRQHGATVIGAMIDESVLGDAFYWTGAITDTLCKIGEKGNLPDFIPDYQALNKFIGNLLSKYADKYSPEMTNYLADKVHAAAEKLDEITKIIEDAKIADANKKEKYKTMYPELARLLKEVYGMPELDKLKFSKLHFTTISVASGDEHIKTSDTAKNLSSILDLNKNIKAINMSYGSNYNVEEYLELSKLKQEDFEKGAKAYNTDAYFRNAVLSWLKSDDEKSEQNMKDYYNGYLGIPSVYKYFASRNQISASDYKKLVDLRLLTLKSVLKEAPEITAANHDILFVRSAGNTYSYAQIDLANYDKNGKKIAYHDPNYKYSNDFASLPTYMNEVEKEKAREEGKEYKYNYNYRKNLLGSVGVVPKTSSYGYEATEDISNAWALYTDKFNYKRLRAFGIGMLSEYNFLIKELNNIVRNPKKYPKGYKEEIVARIKAVDKMVAEHQDMEKDDTRYSFSRAGKAMLWTMAADGSYVYTKRLTNEEKQYSDGEDIGSDIAFGSSFSAPRMTAVAGMIAEKFPWMSAHDIKTSMLTTAIDDYRLNFIDLDKEKEKEKKDEKPTEKPNKTPNIKIEEIGLYGVDENIGWGIMDKEAALDGPARFVKALTHEVGQENFVANVPYGTFTFGNSIQGAFDPIKHMSSRKYITLEQANSLVVTAQFKNEEILDPKFLETHENVKRVLERTKVTPQQIVNELRPKIKKYLPSLSFEERELFQSAGLEKLGKGTLILSGNNTYTEPTYVKEGTLVVQGVQNSDVIVSENAKLKLDSEYIEKGNLARVMLGLEPLKGGIYANVKNKGQLYSYSNKDNILGTYIPYENSLTRIANGARLSVDKLDLSNISHFDIDLFRKYQMMTFDLKEVKKFEDYNDDDAKESNEKTEDTFNKKLIFVAKDVSDADVSKITFGEESVSSGLKMITELKKENNKNIVKIWLERKEHIFDPLNDKKENEGPKVQTLSSKLKKFIVSKMNKKLSDKELNELNIQLDNLEIADDEDVETLDGNILVDSMTLGLENLNIRNRAILDTVEKNTNKSFETFASVQTDTKIRKEDKRNIITTVTNLFAGVGKEFRSKISKHNIAIALNYTNSKLKDLSFKAGLKKENILGDVNVNGAGLAMINTNDFKFGLSTNTIISADYLDKHISRKLLDKDVKDTRSSDFLVDINNIVAYKYEKDLNNKVSLGVKPYIGLDVPVYIKGYYNENSEFGYNSEMEVFVKPSMTLGTKFNVRYDKDLDISIYADYTKYLVDTTLKSKGELKGYKFVNDISGVKLTDNIVNFGLNVNKKIGNLTLGFGYKNRNIKNNALSTMFRYEF